MFHFGTQNKRRDRSSPRSHKRSNRSSRRSKLGSKRTTRRKSSQISPRKVEIDPHPEWTIQQLDVRSRPNRDFVRRFEQLCESDLLKDQSTGVRNKRSRLRQLLMLLTAGESEASLLIDPRTGNTRDIKDVYKLTFELVKPFRMDGGEWWAWLQRWLKSFRKAAYRLSSGSDVVTGITDILFTGMCVRTFYYAQQTGVQGIRNVAKKSFVTNLKEAFETIASSNKHLQVPSKTRFTKAVALFALFTMVSSRSLVKIVSDLIHLRLNIDTLSTLINLPGEGAGRIQNGFQKLMTGQALEEMYFVDGVSKEKQTHMKRLALTLQDLDQSVETISDAELTEKLAKLKRRTNGFIWNSSKTTSLMSLLERGIKKPPVLDVCTFRRKLMSTSQRTYSFHFFTSYGDSRNTAHDIAASYILFEHMLYKMKQRRGPELLPIIAHLSSIGDARKKIT